MAIALDIPYFRTVCSVFADVTKFPDAVIEAWWDVATCYMSDEDYGMLEGNARKLALHLLTGHVMMLTGLAEDDAQPLNGGFTTSATIDKISVAVASPPAKDAWQFWLSSTPYGIQLWALIAASTVGGFSLGGNGERFGFRRGFGGFGG